MRVWFAGGGTGGHLYPALAIARTLVRMNSRIEPFFIGAHRGIEREVLPSTEFPHLLLDLHPLYRSGPWRNWRTIRGVATAWRELSRERDRRAPALLLATGGYAAGAALAHAAVHRVPIALQILDAHPGLTVRLTSRFAREVYLGFAEAEQGLPRGRRTKFIDTGNPIEAPPLTRPDRDDAVRRWDLDPSKPVVLITGGSQGARGINDAVAEWVALGVRHVNLLWATGRANHANLAALDGPGVRVVPYISPMHEAYAAATIAVTRAGAMTTAELCAWGVPSILIPLPTAAADHQTRNAIALENAGASIHRPQAGLSGPVLRDEVLRLIAEPQRLKSIADAALSRGRPEAAQQIGRRILALVG